MFDEYEAIRIKKTGVTGIIIDKTRTGNGKYWYIVEGDIKDENGQWAWYDVWEEDIERKSTSHCTEIAIGA